MSGRASSLVVLRVVFAVVLAILSITTLLHHLPGAHTGHLGLIFAAIALAELVGALLLLVPRTVAIGAATLLVVFAVAVAVHLLHGEWSVGPLVIDAAVAQVFLRRA
jgi:hypothetical protein